MISSNLLLRFFSVSALLCGASASASNENTKLRGNRIPSAPTEKLTTEYHRQLQNSTSFLGCSTTSIVKGMFADETSYIICGTSDGRMYRVTGIPDHVVISNEGRIIDGTIEMDLPSGTKLDDATATLKLPLNANGRRELKFKNKKRTDTSGNSKALFDRSLAVTGTRSVLVVRVISADGVTTASQASLSDSVFGNGVDGTVDTNTPKSRFSACSHGEINFVEASDRNGLSINVRNGATTVTIPTPSSQGDQVMVNDITTELNRQFGVSSPGQLATHVMYCLPPNVDLRGGAAWGFVPGWLTWYSDNYCTVEGVATHEIGHNLGLSHSSDADKEYGDETCVMGEAYNPQVCFNAAKYWQLGWFGSRRQTINAADITSGNQWTGSLIGQIDYTASSDLVLLKLIVGTSSGGAYYIMFNRRRDAVESANHVMITSAANDSGGNPSGNSQVIAKLNGPRGIFDLPNSFDAFGNRLILIADIDPVTTNPARAHIRLMRGIDNMGSKLDTWTGISGNSIANLMSGTNNLASAPNTSVRLQNLLEGPTNIGDNYGSRMKGWLLPPVTGDYLFWIASDDNGELWLSTDSDPANKILACNQPWSAPSRDWTRYPEQKSRPIPLVAGRAYYYEALMKEGGGNDNLAIAWEYPGKALEVIPAKFSRIINPTSRPATSSPTTTKPTTRPTSTPTQMYTVPITNMALSAGSIRHYYMDVIAGQTVSCSTNGPNGDADLYLRFGSEAVPDPAFTGNACSSTLDVSMESCSTAAASGPTKVYAAVHAWSEFSGLTFQCTKSTPSSSPTSARPTSARPTTLSGTAKPTTRKPTTRKPTTRKPTQVPTNEPTTDSPTTDSPTTESPTTESPTTASPTTESPTTESPTTESPTTESPTTESPTTESPTTAQPTLKPTTTKPTTRMPSTRKPTTRKPTTRKPTSRKPTTSKPIL